MHNKDFYKYLISVGIRSLEFTYSDDELFNNVDYFRECMDRGLSPYKALLFLYDKLNDVEPKIKKS